jgi:hypothetical protein
MVDHRLHRRLEALAVGLHTRPLHRAALGAIEHAIVDRTGIGGTGNDAIEGVDLAHEMALAQSANRRVAAHRADLVGIETDQRRARACRAASGRLDAGVTAADHNDVEGMHAPALSLCALWVKVCFTWNIRG